MLPKPSQKEMISFILQTHVVEKLTCKSEDIQSALKLASSPNKQKENPNPYVVGHFDAMNFLLSLIGSPDFPCKERAIITNIWKSEEALWWLRELHVKMTMPLAKASHLPKWEDELNRVKQYECGNLRTTPQPLAFSMAPPPELIPFILHDWLLNLSSLHEKVKHNLDNPYGISKDTSALMIQTTNEIPLLFANLQPFCYGSNRLGRLVENLVRLNWRMKMNVPDLDMPYQSFITSVQKFNTSKLPEVIKQAQATKEKLK